jgi:hypothetical protein
MKHNETFLCIFPSFLTICHLFFPLHSQHDNFSFYKLLSYLMFCWQCIIVYQYNETNIMHFSFILLRIKDLYIFRALLGHPQEVLNKRHLVYCVCIMSIDCGTVAVSLQPCHSQLKSASHWFQYSDKLLFLYSVSSYMYTQKSHMIFPVTFIVTPSWNTAKRV